VPIGVSPFGADVRQQPELFHTDAQAGAPPDMFAVKGQNWSFPTYDWARMKETGFAWWKRRFAQMGNYFDAFRIDHILGFFRIWCIPKESVQGIMGHFDPAIPVRRSEFNDRGIWFDHDRYTKPYINEAVIWEIFGNDSDRIKEEFLKATGNGFYDLKESFNTQWKVEEHFSRMERTELTTKLRSGLSDLISNLILFDVEGTGGQQFHFRIAMENTSSFRYLEWNTQQQLKWLYLNYFFSRREKL